LLDTVKAAVAPTHATIWIRPPRREATGYHSTKLQTPG
jgi:hypothetical protein